MPTYRDGNLLDDDAEVLVCTTNANGKMGKGLALDFRRRWRGIEKPYERDCGLGLLRGGSVRLYDLPEPRDLLRGGPQRRWAAFCTKHNYWENSEYAWVQSGLDELLRLLAEGGHRSVAVPPLGCGLGGLDWARVGRMVEDAFARHPGIDARVYGTAPAPLSLAVARGGVGR